MMSAPVGTSHRKPSADAGEPVPSGCTNFKLRQLTRRVTQHFDRIVAPAGLKTTQYSLLSHIERLGPVAPGALARAMTMDASTLTRNLKPLIKLGWVELGPGVNGRSRVVTATAAGRAKRAEAARQWKRAQFDLNARLGNAKVAHLHNMLEECLALLEPEAESVDG